MTRRRAIGYGLVILVTLVDCRPETPAPTPEPNPAPQIKATEPPLIVQVRKVSRSRGGRNAEVSGSVENNGARELATCTIAVLFLDSAGKVIDRQTTYVNALPAGQASNWRVLRPWDPRFDSATAEFESITLR